jgi:hypothetical protein
LVSKYNIDCCFQRSAHTTFAMNPEEKETIDTETEGAAKAGTWGADHPPAPELSISP